MPSEIVSIIKKLNIVDCHYALARLRGENLVYGEGALVGEINRLISLVAEADAQTTATVQPLLLDRAHALTAARDRAYDCLKRGNNEQACVEFEQYFNKLASHERDMAALQDYDSCRRTCHASRSAARRVRTGILLAMGLLFLVWFLSAAVFPATVLAMAQRQCLAGEWSEVRLSCRRLESVWLRYASFGLVPRFAAKEVARLGTAAAVGIQYDDYLPAIRALIVSNRFDEASQALEPFVKALGVPAILASGVTLSGPLTIAADPAAIAAIRSLSASPSFDRSVIVPPSGSLVLLALPTGTYNLTLERAGYYSTNITAQLLPFASLTVAAPLQAKPVQVALLGSASTVVLLNDQPLGHGGDTVSVPHGKSQLVVQSPLHEPQTITVEGAPGAVISLDLPVLDPVRATLYVHAAASDPAVGQLVTNLLGLVARIDIDGVDRGAHRLPAALAADLGVRHVKISLSNYTMVRQSVETRVSESNSNVVVVPVIPDPARLIFDCGIPGCILTIDSRQVLVSGETIQLPSSVPHSLTVSAPGYQAWCLTNALFAPGESRTISPSLEQLPGFYLSCGASNVSVSIDGTPVAPLLGRYVVPTPGCYAVRVESDGFEPWICSNALIKAGRSYSLTPTLVPLLSLDASRSIYYEDGIGYVKCDVSVRPNPLLRPTGRDFILLLDSSLSMRAFCNYDATLSALLKHCNPDDRLEIVSFASSVRQCFGEPKPLGDQTKLYARQFVQSISGGGTTDLEKALGAVTQMRNMFSSNHHVILCIVTDGVPTDGTTSIAKLFANLSAALQRNLTIFTVIAAKPSRDLCDVLAWRYGGECFYVKDADDVRKSMESIAANTENVLLNSCKIVCPQVSATCLKQGYLCLGATNSFFVAVRPPLEQLSCRFSGLQTGRPVDRDVSIDIRQATAGDGSNLLGWEKNQIYQLYWDVLEYEGSESRTAHSREAEFALRFSALKGRIPGVMEKQHFKKRYSAK